jgi:hypothetical protein
LACLSIGCGSGAGAEPVGQAPGQPSGPAQPAKPLASELGTGDGTSNSVVLTEIVAPGAGLQDPTDLEFDRWKPELLWIVDRDANAVLLVHDAPTDARRTEIRDDAAALHFLHKPTALAFGGAETTFGIPGTWASCGESRNENGIEGSRDFMGPALWSSDLSIFAKKDPEGLGSHLDMLHTAPLCMGIAHETENVYWATNGRTGGVIRYDFGTDHGIGKDDHSTGAAREYARGLVKYREGVPGHLAWHAGSKNLFIADPAGGRILAIDGASGTQGTRLADPDRLEGGYFRMDGVQTFEIVPAGVFEVPSGLEIHDDLLFVTDWARGTITALRLDGTEVRRLDTGLGAGALGGITFGPDGKIYLVDRKAKRVLRIDPK